MRPITKAIGAGVVLALAITTASSAKLTEVGVLPETTPATVPSCPTPLCLAVSRTTGFQVKIEANRGPLVAPRAGVVVAWTISLGKPTPAQIKFFNEHEGGAASAAVAILRPQKKPKLTYTLVAQGPIVQLQPYFGMSSVEFPLERTLPVHKGDIVALTVPTWAPALALGFQRTTSWRASRPKKQCSTTSGQTAQTQLNVATQYYCLYQTARLTYSATLISTP